MELVNQYQNILAAFGFLPKDCQLHPLGNGLINLTWKLSTPNGPYLLQRINTNVFKDPTAIAWNLQQLGQYLAVHKPDYFFTTPITTRNGDPVYYDEQHGYFRLFPFVSGSLSYDTVPKPEIAFEAARAFGRFARNLDAFDISSLKITIPGFHDLALRFRQFEEATELASPEMKQKADPLLRFALEHAALVQKYTALVSDPAFRLRVMHHDTKISNVLFNEKDQAICVIDLDTVMPGYIISDLGDMMRTYLSPVSEEETDLYLVRVRPEYFQAITEGYLSEMAGCLSAAEKQAIPLAGPMIIYMQALRFLTDHLLGDIYYGARYPGHNFNRAANQFRLLEEALQY